MSPKPSRCSFQ